MLFRVVLCASLALAGTSAPVFAQADRSVWGFSGSFVPQWKTPAQLAILFDGDTVDLSGSELRAGVVRGRPTGGDWGVSFVRKNFADGSNVSRDDGQQCFNNACFNDRSSSTFQDVTITGVEAHRFFPFATIKRRAQIGLTIAGGVGSWKGTARREASFVEFRGNTPVQRQVSEDVPVEELFVLNRKMVPLFRLEIAGTAIVSDNFKVRVGGGVNFPGTQTFGIQGIFLLPQ